jgi:hypothetical protein
MAPKRDTTVPLTITEMEVPPTRRCPQESTLSTWDARTSAAFHYYYYMPYLTTLVYSDSQDLGVIPLSRYGSLADHHCH